MTHLPVLSIFKGSSYEPLEPPVHVLDDWLRLFAGDLLAFSAAVARRALTLSQGEFTLHAKDASEYVLREYLQELDAAERQALDSLSVLAELEVSASLASIGGHFPTQSSARGLALRTSTFDDTRTRLRLVHPGMGRLLLAAAGEPVDPARMLTRAATAESAIQHLAESAAVGRKNSPEQAEGAARGFVNCLYPKSICS